MELAQYTLGELGIVGSALMLLFFGLRIGYDLFKEQIKSQSKETEGNQQITQQQTALTQTSLALLSQANDRISRTLEAMYELKKSDHTILLEIKESSRGSHQLLQTDIPAAVMRVETPVTVVLAAVNEILPKVNAVYDYCIRDKAVMEKQLAIARHAKPDELPETPAEGQAPQAGESAAPVVSENTEVSK